MSSESITSLFTSSNAFWRSRYTAAVRLLLVLDIEMSFSRMLMAYRVPDPGLKPVALMSGGFTDHLILCSINFSMTFPITGSSDIGLYELFFFGIGTIVAYFQEDGSLPSFSDLVYSFELLQEGGGAFLSMSMLRCRPQVMIHGHYQGFSLFRRSCCHSRYVS